MVLSEVGAREVSLLEWVPVRRLSGFRAALLGRWRDAWSLRRGVAQVGGGPWAPVGARDYEECAPLLGRGPVCVGSPLVSSTVLAWGGLRVQSGRVRPLLGPLGLRGLRPGFDSGRALPGGLDFSMGRAGLHSRLCRQCDERVDLWCDRRVAGMLREKLLEGRTRRPPPNPAVMCPAEP